MKTLNRTISILLAVALVFGLLPQIAMGARAAETTEPPDSPAYAGGVPGTLKTVTLTQINPLYANILDVSDLVEPQAQTQAASEYYASAEKAGNAVREHLKNREESIVVGIQTASNDSQIMHDVFDSALAHTGIPTEGDYLAWQYGGWKGSMSGYVSNGVYYLTLTYTVTYYTTAEQEAEMDTAVANLLAELNLGTANDYDKVEGIYDWICKNISYIWRIPAIS